MDDVAAHIDGIVTADAARLCSTTDMEPIVRGSRSAWGAQCIAGMQ
jgi:hypothetical protein